MTADPTRVGRSAIDPAGTDAVIAQVLADRPDVVDALRDAHAAAWASVEPRDLELCRRRVAQLLGCDAEAAVIVEGAGRDAVTGAEFRNWPNSVCFDERDRAVLAWCEMFVIDVASLDDPTVSEVAGHVGHDGLVDLTNALLVIEQRQRLRCTWDRLGLTGPSTTQPASTGLASTGPESTIEDTTP